MKKILTLISAIFLLAACTQTNETMNSYKDEELNISFNYPSDWKIDEQDRFEHAVGFSTGDNEYIFFDYQADAEKYKKSFQENDKVTMEETTLADYPVEEYHMEGAVKYLIEIEDKFVLFDSEFEFTEAQKEGMKELLNSLSL